MATLHVAGQRSLDDLGTPLHDVTFCVVDVETTGGSAVDGALTEIGAVKLRGGRCLGTFSTLLDPGVGIPPAITVLTGITDSMVRAAPRVEAVLPSLLEFLAGSVIVGHNVRYDLGFLDAALVRHGYPRLGLRWVDTCGLSRRLFADEVPNHRLATLAERLRLPHRPTHRALDDALATGDLLHVLLERAAGHGVLGLDDLLELPTVKGHPQLAKLRLTEGLPRATGVYLFRDAAGRVLYVGKATDLRARVRSYFGGHERRKVAQLLREAARIDHVVTRGTLEAAVLEVRLIHQHRPRFNRQSKSWPRYRYVKLTLGERFPRLSVVRVARDDGAVYLGPLPSTAAARLVIDAVHDALPLRRCTADPRRAPRSAPCAPAQLGVSTCPCAGEVDPEEYARVVAAAVAGLTGDAGVLLEPLRARLRTLAAAERFEEAAELRDRAAALAGALRRQRRLDALRRAGRLLLALPGGDVAELDGGRLTTRWDEPELPLVPPPERPLPTEAADELACVAAWLDKEAPKVRLLRCEGLLASPLPALPSFQPRR